MLWSWWSYHFVSAKLIFTEGTVSLLLNVPWSAEKPIKVQSSSLLLLSVFALCTETLQKGQESSAGGAGWAHCRDLCAGGNQSSGGNLWGWSAVWMRGNAEPLALLQNQSQLLKCDCWELRSWSFRWHLAEGWHSLSEAVIQGSFRVSVTQQRKQCKKLLWWYN